MNLMSLQTLADACGKTECTVKYLNKTRKLFLLIWISFSVITMLSALTPKLKDIYTPLMLLFFSFSCMLMYFNLSGKIKNINVRRTYLKSKSFMNFRRKNMNFNSWKIRYHAIFTAISLFCMALVYFLKISHPKMGTAALLAFFLFLYSFTQMIVWGFFKKPLPPIKHIEANTRNTEGKWEVASITADSNQISISTKDENIHIRYEEIIEIGACSYVNCGFLFAISTTEKTIPFLLPTRNFSSERMVGAILDYYDQAIP